MPYQNIVLIDDDEDDIEIFKAALAEVSASVKCTSFLYAKDAFHKLVLQEVTPQAIFLDLNMPMMNGEQFLVEMKKNSALKHIPVIIFSTTSNPNTIQFMKTLGAHDFVTKPLRYSDLVNLLKPFFG